MRTNVLDKDSYQNLVKEVLDFTANTLSKSLGPYGSNTLIQQKVESFLTKDGDTILKYLMIDESDKDAILTLIKNITRKLVSTVGDGSTSAIVTAAAFYKNFDNRLKKLQNFTPKQLMQILTIMVKFIEDVARQKAKRINVNNDDIYNIAKIATNNDSILGKLIADAYKEVGEYGIITQQLSKNEISSYEIKPGFEIYGSYVTVSMVNDTNNNTAEYNDAITFIVEGMVDNKDMEGLSKIIEYAMAKNKPLVIIAEEYDTLIKQFFHINLQQKSNTFPIKLLAITIPHNTADDKEVLLDLSAYLNIPIYNKNKCGNITIEKISTEYLGTLNHIITYKNKSIITMNDVDTLAIKERVKYIKEKLNDITNIEMNTGNFEDSLVHTLKRRMAYLTKSLAVINIGCNSNIERKNERFLIEDAILAVKSAIKNGYNIGGSLYIPFLINTEGSYIISKAISYIQEHINLTVTEEDLKVICDILFSSFMTTFRKILENAEYKQQDIATIMTKCITDNVIYNVNTKNYEFAQEATVINSVETDIEIMKTVVSIIGLIYTSNQMLSIFPEYNRVMTLNEQQTHNAVVVNADKIIDAPPRL